MPSWARRWGQVLAGGLGVALAVAIFLAPFASEVDDGLEWVGGKLGFLKKEEPVLATGRRIGILRHHSPQ